MIVASLCKQTKLIVLISCYPFADMMPGTYRMPYLRFEDDSLKSSFQESLSLMRKNRLFCDVILHVSAHSASTVFPDTRRGLIRTKE